MTVRIFLSFLLCLCSGVSSDCFAEKGGLLGTSLPGKYRPFSDDSPWNMLIGDAPVISPHSKAMIRHLSRKTGHIKGSMIHWTVPLFVIDASRSPLRTVYTKEPLHPGMDPDKLSRIPNVPIPDGVWPDPKKDGHMLLVDPVQSISWDFSRAKLLPDGNWQATRVEKWDLTDSGCRKPFAGKRWWTFGARGSGMPLIAGLIRPEEIETGEIRHALVCATPVNRNAKKSGNKELCSPVASRTDGKLDGTDTIPMGARLQLDPSLDIEDLQLSPETKIIARAMQRYGLYVGDGSPTFKLYFQNLGHNKGRWRSISDFTDLRKIPIDKFRVLDCKIIKK